VALFVFSRLKKNLKFLEVLCLILFSVLFQLVSVHAHAYEGQMQRTVNNVLEAYGGKNNVLKIKTISAHGRIDGFLRKTSGGYARTMRRPGELRIDIMPERGGEVRILSNGKGLQGSGPRLSAAKPTSLSSMRYQYGYLDLPMSLADGSAKAIHRGVEELHGRPMEILFVELTSAPNLKVYIDFETHLVRRVEAKFDMGGMGSSVLGTEYDNSKIVDGAVFPLTLNNFAGGKNISVLTITRLTINQALPDGVFSSNS
jgi:hypothetical protein